MLSDFHFTPTERFGLVCNTFQQILPLWLLWLTLSLPWNKTFVFVMVLSYHTHVIIYPIKQLTKMSFCRHTWTKYKHWTFQAYIKGPNLLTVQTTTALYWNGGGWVEAELVLISLNPTSPSHLWPESSLPSSAPVPAPTGWDSFVCIFPPPSRESSFWPNLGYVRLHKHCLGLYRTSLGRRPTIFVKMEDDLKFVENWIQPQISLNKMVFFSVKLLLLL